MPWTIAHAAAALPFRRWCPGAFSCLGLVVGTVTPDLGYYLALHELADFGHTLPGLVLVCLPSGLLLAALAWRLRELLVTLIPQPHRSALRRALAAAEGDFALRRAAVLAASVLLGAATHVVWDSFTHATGWPVGQFELLRRDVFAGDGPGIPLYAVLQHASTLFGIVVLAWAYRAWLRECRAAGLPVTGPGNTARRWIVLGILALGLGLCAALIAAGVRRGEANLSVLVVRAVFAGSNVMAVTYLAAAWLWRRLRRDEWP